MISKDASWTSQTISNICQLNNFKVVTNPYDPSLLKIVFPNGKSTIVSSSSLNINGSASRFVTNSKHLTKFYLDELGIQTPKGIVVTLFGEVEPNTVGLSELSSHLSGFSWPLVAKPVNGYQGEGVSLVSNESELFSHLREISLTRKKALIEERITGFEYRLVVYKNNLEFAYEKTPLRVLGDGENTVKYLLLKKRDEQESANRGDVISPQWGFLEKSLHLRGYTMEDILPVGLVLNLRDNANLSTGGDIIDHTGKVHKDYIELARQVTGALDLKLSGIDIFTNTPISDPCSSYCVLEVSYTPGFKHFASLGSKQLGLVNNLYLQILKDLQV